jgi:predicted GNAT family acetyltransferase
MSSLVLKHRADLQSYHLLDGEDVVSEVGYDRHGSTLVLLHTATREDVRHRGYASALVESVLAELSAQPDHVVVRCPFVRWWQAADPAQRSRPCVT